MTRRITRTPQAIEDLAQIAAYIAKDNPHAARKLGATLDAKTQLLAAQPDIGTPDPERPGRRIHVVGSYLIQYRETPDGVVVLRSFHGRRDRRRM